MKTGELVMITGRSTDGMSVTSTMMPILLLQDTDDPMSLIKAASLEYCRTREGLAAYDGNGRSFDLADFWYQVPDSLCVKHGFKKQSAVNVLEAPDNEPLFETKDIRLTEKLIDDVCSELDAGPVGELKDMLYCCGYPGSLSFLDGGIDDEARRAIREYVSCAHSEEAREDVLEYWMDHCASIYFGCGDGAEGVAE